MPPVPRILTGLAALAVAGCFAGAASAQGQVAPQACAAYPTVRDNLRRGYKDVPIARAVSGEGKSLMVIFAAPEGRTWTAVSVRAHDRLACIVAAGTDWDPSWVAL